ncbi:SEC11C, partial [Cervus elaphus hippelaphus]
MPEGASARGAGEAGGRGRAGAPQLSATPGAGRLPRCAPPDPTGDTSMVRASTVGAHLPASGLDIFGDLRKMNKRQSPIVVVLSGSMEPAFHRGDLLFLTNFREDPIRAGEIVVFKVEGRDIPIVHRVIKVHE